MHYSGHVGLHIVSWLQVCSMESVNLSILSHAVSRVCNTN